jgi:RND superfamily putative drug exporter
LSPGAERAAHVDVGFDRAVECPDVGAGAGGFGGEAHRVAGEAAPEAVGAHSGRTIFAAGAVMVAVFFTFALSGPIPPKEMGVILGVAVILDAMLIRLVLMPVLLRLMGRHAWALPGWLDRVLPNVTFGHSGTREPSPHVL